jgi:hypothetical protein
LKHRVRVQGKTEAHTEGVYYIEWREAGKRRREAIPNRHEVLGRARLKALELEAKKAGISIRSEALSSTAGSLLGARPPSLHAALPGASDASSLLVQGIAAYLQEAINRLSKSQRCVDKEGQGPDEPHSWTDAQPLRQAHPAAREREVSPNEPGTGQHSKTPIADAIELYLKDIEPPQREQKTYDEYRSVLYRFRDSCQKTFVEEINRSTCLSFMRHLYSIGNEARTVYNRICIVIQWLKLQGITGLLQSRDMPKYVENVRKMYEPGDLEALFRACTPEERVPYLFLLLTGERDKEVRYTTWSDIDFTRKCVRVTAKKQLGFKPKDKEEREIPVPACLLAALQEHKARQSRPNPHDLTENSKTS